MPLNLPDKLPAIELLKEENIFVIDNSRATQQDIRPLRIVILNLMPLKITTETDLVRLLSNTPLQVEISFMKIKSHTSKNTPIEHMKTFYTDFDKMRGEKYDGMIITAANLTKDEMRNKIRQERRVELAFENHRFWDVRRWKIAEIVDNKKVHKITVNADGTYSYPVFQNRVFDKAKHYLFPIPQSEIDKNRNLVQNPGWN